MRVYRTAAMALGLSFALALSGTAFAAEQGSSGATSGPAAGGNVQPGTDNNASAQGNGQKGTTGSGGGAGVAGPKGSKNGPSDQPPSK